jgi:hypothetical protein
MIRFLFRSVGFLCLAAVAQLDADDLFLPRRLEGAQGLAARC